MHVCVCDMWLLVGLGLHTGHSLAQTSQLTAETDRAVGNRISSCKTASPQASENLLCAHTLACASIWHAITVVRENSVFNNYRMLKFRTGTFLYKYKFSLLIVRHRKSFARLNFIHSGCMKINPDRKFRYFALYHHRPQSSCPVFKTCEGTRKGYEQRYNLSMQASFFSS